MLLHAKQKAKSRKELLRQVKAADATARQAKSKVKKGAAKTRIEAEEDYKESKDTDEEEKKRFNTVCEQNRKIIGLEDKTVR